MAQLYPPILSSRLNAIFEVSGPTAGATEVIVPFYMPAQNDISAIKHVQLIIKVNQTVLPAINPTYSPDKAVLFYKAIIGKNLVHVRDDLWQFVFRYDDFMNGLPKNSTDYYIQLRFGSQQLWPWGGTEVATDAYGRPSTFTGYAQWRRVATTSVPSLFGEWSNKGALYCAKGAASSTIAYNYNDFVPEIEFTFSDNTNDPIANTKVLWYYNSLNGTVVKSEVFNGNLATDNTYLLKYKLPVAPIQITVVTVEAVTVHNTTIERIIEIPPITHAQTSGQNFIPCLNETIESVALEGEESQDGTIAKGFQLSQPITAYPVIPFPYPSDKQIRETKYFHFYRIDLMNLDTVRVSENEIITFDAKHVLKDYSVEMGVDYQYVAVGFNAAGVATCVYSNLYPAGLQSDGYGRLTSMAATFLVDKYHQLRLEGNVQVSNFNPNVQDSLQTTLGAKYPFYSRNAKVNYRTMQISALMSINFDPTATFLYHDQPHLKGSKNVFSDIATLRPARGDIYRIENTSTWTDPITSVTATYWAGYYIWTGSMWNYHAVDGTIQSSVATFNNLPTTGVVNKEIRLVTTTSIETKTGMERKAGWYRCTLLPPLTPVWELYDLAAPALDAYTDAGLWWVQDENNKTFHIFDRDLYNIEQISLNRQRAMDRSFKEKDPDVTVSSTVVNFYANLPTTGVPNKQMQYVRYATFDTQTPPQVLYKAGWYQYQSGTWVSVERGNESTPSYSQDNAILNLKKRNPDLAEIRDRTYGPISVYDARLHRNKKLAYGSDKEDNVVYIERKFREFVMSWLSNGKAKLFRSETEGNMIVVATGVSFAPFDKSARMVYTASMTLTEIAPYDLESLVQYELLPTSIESYYNPISEFRFSPGDPDPDLRNGLIYQYRTWFDIPGGADGTPIAPYDTYNEVYNGTPPFTFSAVGLPNGVTIGPMTGIVGGTLTNGPQSPGTATLTVRDATGQTASMIINVNQLFGSLVFLDDPKFDIYPNDPITGAERPGVVGEPLVFNTTPPVSTMDVSPNASGGESPYQFWALGLPIGVTIDRNTGVISGRPIVGNYQSTAQIFVQDRLGQQQFITINIGRVLNSLTILGNLAAFEIPQLAYNIHNTAADLPNYPSGSVELTGSYTMKDPAAYISGGLERTTVPRYQLAFPPFNTAGQVYTYSSVLYPNNTNPIREDFLFIPNRVSPAGNFDVVSTDALGAVSTLVGATHNKVIESLSINYQGNANTPYGQPAMNPPLVFSPIGLDVGAGPSDMPITYVMPPRELEYFVEGGVKPYTYKIPNLSANFLLNENTGTLTAHFRSSEEAHDRILYVTDSRGVTVQRTLRFERVGDGLKATYISGWCGNPMRWRNPNQIQQLYGRKMMNQVGPAFNSQASWAAGMDLPPMRLGKDPANGTGVAATAYKFNANGVSEVFTMDDGVTFESYNFAGLITGGQPPYKFYANSATYPLPRPWRLAVTGEMIWEGGPGMAVLTDQRPETSIALIRVEDSSPGAFESTTFYIKVGPITRQLEFKLDPAKHFIPMLAMGTELESGASRGDGTGAKYNNSTDLQEAVKYGYKGFSSFFEFHESPLGSLAPYRIGETNGRLSGGKNATGGQGAATLNIGVIDDFGDTAGASITGGGIVQPMPWNPVAQKMPYLTALWSTVPQNQIYPITLQNAPTGTTYALDGGYSTLPGDILTYDRFGSLEGSYDPPYAFNGQPQREYPEFNMIPFISATVPPTNATYRPPSAQTWMSPKVFPMMGRPGLLPSQFDRATGMPPMSLGPIDLNKQFRSGLIVNNKSSWQEEYPGTSYVIERADANWNVISGPALPPGLALESFSGAAADPYKTSSPAYIVGTPTQQVNDWNCILTATRPLNQFTPVETLVVRITIKGIASGLTFIPVPTDINVPRLNPGDTMTPIDISACIFGGSGNYTVEVVDPGGTTNIPGMTGLTLHKDTSGNWVIDGTVAPGTATTPRGTLTLKAIDNLTGDSKLMDIPLGGVGQPLNFIYLPSNDIPTMDVGQQITAQNIYAQVSGGTGPGTYVFSSVDGGIDTLAPYQILTDNSDPLNLQAIIYGDSGVLAQAAKKARITVTDADGNSAYIDINVGEIRGPLSFSCQSVNIPDNLYSAGDAINGGGGIDLKTVTAGGSGTGYTYSIIRGQLPPGITLSANGIISGIFTGASNLTEVTIEVTDSNGNKAQDQFSIGPVMGPFTFTDSPTFDIPAMPIGSIPIGEINFFDGVAGGLDPYEMVTLSVGGYDIDPTTGRLIIETSSRTAPQAALTNQTITVKDQNGLMASITINVGEIYPPLEVELLNSMDGIELIQGVSNINPPRLVIRGIGGPTGSIYSYSFMQADASYGQMIVPGVTLNAVTGEITGVPLDLQPDWTQVAARFRVGITAASIYGVNASLDWKLPKVVEDLYYKDVTSTVNPPLIKIDWMVQGRAMTTDDYILGGLSTATEAQVVIAGATPLNTPNTPLAGLQIDPQTGIIAGTPTYISSPDTYDPSVPANMLITIRRTSPAALYTPQRTLDRTIQFAGVVGILRWAGTIPPAVGTLFSTYMVAGYSYGYEWYPHVLGGVRSYKFEVSSNQGAGVPPYVSLQKQTTTSKADSYLVFNLPTDSSARGRKSIGQIFTIRASDSAGETITRQWQAPDIYYRLIGVTQTTPLLNVTSNGTTQTYTATANGNTATQGGSSIPGNQIVTFNNPYYAYSYDSGAGRVYPRTYDSLASATFTDTIGQTITVSFIMRVTWYTTTP